MIISKQFKQVISEISRGESLFPTLKRLGIQPMDFFKYVESEPEHEIAFSAARRVKAELDLEASILGIDRVSTELEFKKSSLKVSTLKWMAEKIAHKTYGQKMTVEVNKTIDIRAVLEEARGRIVEIKPRGVPLGGRGEIPDDS